MNILTLRECREYGWQVGELPEFIGKKYDEDWEDPEAFEVIRRIARTQDAWSITRTRAYIRSRLVARRPARRYNPDLNEIVDATLRIYLFGDDMPLSSREARIQEQRQEKRQEELNSMSYSFSLEINGMEIHEVRAFILDSLIGKYTRGGSYTNEDVEKPLIDAIQRANFAFSNISAFQQQLAKNPNSPVLIALAKKVKEHQSQSKPTELFRTKTLVVYGDPLQVGRFYLAKQVSPDNQVPVVVNEGRFLGTPTPELIEMAGGEQWLPALAKRLQASIAQGAL